MSAHTQPLKICYNFSTFLLTRVQWFNVSHQILYVEILTPKGDGLWEVLKPLKVEPS